ncbi:MAG: DUF1553 domain-containing protein [Pirellulaceae bacterium]
MLRQQDLFLALPLLLFYGWAPLCAGEDPAPTFFEKQVKPVLVERCLQCHGADRKGGLDLRARETALEGGESGAVIEPGQPDDSLLVAYVESNEMPPGRPLPVEEVNVLRQWIAEGAYFPPVAINALAVTTSQRAGYDWWSLQPLADPVLPNPHNVPQAWTDHPIDRFVAAQLQALGLQPAPPADRRTLIRRASYDLTGLPPSIEEVESFVHDEDPEAYERLIDRLLDSPHYGEQWGRHWLDVVRFGESNGFERNQIIENAWPFRDYVIRSFNADKPFHQLVREHLAGDVIGAGDSQVEVGTTFLVCGPYDDVGNQDPVQAAQIRANTVDDMIRATGETFLGMTVGCARCHDHKFDPVTQRDYYALYATLAGVHHGSRQLGTAEQKQERTEKVRVLQERKAPLAQRKSGLEEALLARAEKDAAALESTWQRPAVSRQGTEETFAPVEARYVRLTVLGLDTNPVARTGYRIDEFEVWTAERPTQNVAQASAGATAMGESPIAEDFAGAYSAELAIDGQFGAPWIAAGPELTVTFARPARIDRVFFSSDRSGAASDQSIATFVSDYRIDVSSDNQHWTTVASSADRRPVNTAHRRKRLMEHAITQQERQQLAEITAELAAIDRQLAEIPPLPTWWVGELRAGEGPFHIFIGGSPDKPGETVVPASPTALAAVIAGYELPGDAPESQRRQRLADWLVSSDNPLTPRVLANRIWHYHFGVGIVDTPSDFGYMGGKPTHPELLDWLARQLQAHDWRLKPLHRLIMLSQTYRQASTWDARWVQIDARSRYLWRYPPRRLTAEEIRDSILAIAGQLNREMGGPGFRLYRYMQDNVATYVPLDQFRPETYRRSVYHQNARSTQIDLITDFDGPDCAFAAPRRDSTTTPLQALTMMNHSFTQEMARAWAERIIQEVRGADRSEPAAMPTDPERGVVRAFQLAFTRNPSEAELAAGTQLIQAHGLPALCRALLNSNELIYAY